VPEESCASLSYVPKRCPICKKAVPDDAEHRPFCSERCKAIDLGRWLNEDYRISRPLTSEELPPPEDEGMTE
jgi:uncharacterized protein